MDNNYNIHKNWLFSFTGAFEDDDVTHVEGEVNPVRDLDIIGEELRLKDEETMLKNLDKLEKTVGRGLDKKVKPELVSTFLLLYMTKISVTQKQLSFTKIYF